MFDRYTEKARRAIFFARYEASSFGSPYIETEHILLGLLREDKRLFLKLVPAVDYALIREEVAKHSSPGTSVSTSVDLALSNESQRVLAYSAEEAERLNHKHIGTEHLLLALLREKKSPGAQLLEKHGAKLAELRIKLGAAGISVFAHDSYEAPRHGYGTTIEIHGQPRNLEYVRSVISSLHQQKWHWIKKPWSARDIVRDKQGEISFDLSLAQAGGEFELMQQGWKKDHCAICHWPLFESQDHSEHGVGYSNGRDWLCTECYEKFIERPEFFASNYPEIT